MAGIAGIIFSNLNDNTLTRLTGERTVGAIPFASRYRLIDFCISNMINSGVSNVNIATNYNYRSLVEHIGSGKDYDLARRIGGINIIASARNITIGVYHFENFEIISQISLTGRNYRDIIITSIKL